jgi:hypothetical protein
MREPFIGSEALAAGQLSRHQLRTRYFALHQDIYVPNNVVITAAVRAKACWLRSRRRGILAGFSASALHGAKWIDPARSAAIIDTNRRPTPGIEVFADRIEDDEVWLIDGMPVTNPARTALDLANHYSTGVAVPAIDSLAQATDVKTADIEQLIQRYRGRRGIRGARAMMQLVDPGAQSPKETWLRLLLVRAGFPRPSTQIPVRDKRDEFGQVLAYLDMGWEDIMVAVEYDGDQHRTDRRQYVKDIRRAEMVERLGWLIVRVVAEDHPDGIIRRVRDARARRM